MFIEDLAFVIALFCIAVLILVIVFCKREKTDEKEQEFEAPRPIIKLVDYDTEIAKARVTIPKERIVTGWDTEKYGVRDEAQEYVLEELKRLITEEVFKHAIIVQRENPMDLTLEYEAIIRVVKM